MKTIKILLFLLSVWMIVSFCIINDKVKDNTRLIKEVDTTYTLTEALEIYKQGYQQGGLRFAGNEWCYKAYYNSIKFEADSVMFERKLKRYMK